jgi:hypothetical protein
MPLARSCCVLPRLAFILCVTSGTGAAALPTTHPYLFFEDLGECHGYQNRAQDPWQSWEQAIVRDADQNLGTSFGSGDYALVCANLGMAYQITKLPSYAAQAAQALIRVDPNAWGSPWIRDMALAYYAIGYDLAQPGMTVDEDAAARDALARLADAAYQDATSQGPDYINYSDEFGREYWSVGLAGMALHDYSPSALGSGPQDWLDMGETDTMVDDRQHPGYHRGLVTFVWDHAGHNLDGAYRDYTIIFESLYAHAFTHFYGENFLDKYPLAKEHFKSEIWETLPNGYMSNVETLGETRQRYLELNIDLYDAANQSYMASQIDRVAGAHLLPYSSDDVGSGYSALASYLMTMNTASIPRRDPPDHMLDPRSMLLTMRNGFGAEGSFLSIIQWNQLTWAENSNRESSHSDQLSIEFYDKGDLVLADGGEPKYVYGIGSSLNPDDDAALMYGMHEFFHNVLAVERPGTAFPNSSWANSPARGFAKGYFGAGGPYHNDILNPVTTHAAASTSWVALVDDSLTGTETPDGPLSSAIDWSRQLIYPEGEYVIVIDRAQSNGTWLYRSIFRPATNDITPTEGETVGHENLELMIGDNVQAWQNAAHRVEVELGLAHVMTWTATNCSSKPVETTLYTAPESTVVMNKLVTRIGGYGKEANVFAPVVYFKQPTAQNTLYRVTAIMSRYASEPQKATATVPVAGTGNAISVTWNDAVDYAYTGTGTSTFGPFSTDADTVYARDAEPVTFTLIGGTHLDASGTPVVSSSTPLGYLTWQRLSFGRKLKAKTSTAGTISIHGLDAARTYVVLRNGESYPQFTMADGDTRLDLTAAAGEYYYEVLDETTPDGGVDQFDSGIVPDGGVAADGSAGAHTMTASCGCHASTPQGHAAVLLILYALCAVACRWRRGRHTPASAE